MKNMMTSITARVLGQRIRQMRTRRGLTQQDLAGDDYSKSYISAIEQGKTRPSLEALQRMAARLEMPPGTLLDPDAQGFAPFDPEAMPRRVRRGRTGRAGSKDIFGSDHMDLKLAEAELLVLTGRPSEALQLLRPLIPEEREKDKDRDKPGPGRPPADLAQVQRIFYLLSLAAVRAGSTSEAIGYLQKGQQHGNRTGDIEYLERIRNLLGVAYYQADQPLSALEHHKACLDAVEAGRVRDPNFKLLVYNNIAADYNALHDNERAADAYKKALTLLEDVNSIERQASIFWELSQTYTGMQEWALARQYAVRAVSVYDALENMQMVAQMENNYGDILVQMGDLSGAERYLSHSLELAVSLNSPTARAVALTDMARLDMKQGNPEGAQARIDEAVEIARGAVREPSAAGRGSREGGKKRGGMTDAHRILAKSLAVAGEISTERGDHERADQAFSEAISLIEGGEGNEVSSDIYQRYAQVLANRGEHQQASKYFERAYRVVTKRR